MFGKKLVGPTLFGAVALLTGKVLFEYVQHRDSSALKTQPPQYAPTNQAIKWAQQLEQLPQQTVQLVAHDGWTLTGFLTSNPQNLGTVLIVHGFGVDHHSLDKIGGLFYQLGYNVLQPDNRAAGLSGGDYLSYGYLEKYDVKLWLEWLQQQSQLQKPLILFGASMGAATVLQSLALSLPSQLAGVIADSSYTNAQAISEYTIHRQFKLPSKALTKLISLWSKVKFGASYAQIDAQPALRQTKVPVLLIRGLKDTTVPPQMSVQLMQEATSAVQLVDFVNGSHIRSIESDPKRYAQVIQQFCAQVTAKK